MRLVKSPNDIAFGAALLLLAGVLYWQVSSLRVGTIMRMGPGYLPSILCGLIALAAIGIVVRALFEEGEKLHSWPLREMGFLFSGLLAFGVLIERGGLFISMPALIILVSLADRDSKPIEVAALAAVLTLFSALVFVFALRLPIPLWPAG